MSKRKSRSASDTPHKRLKPQQDEEEDENDIDVDQLDPSPSKQVFMLLTRSPIVFFLLIVCFETIFRIKKQTHGTPISL